MKPADLLRDMKDFHPIERRDAFLSTFIFSLGMALYVRTLAPGLLFGDGAEFQTLAYTMGMTHPTGYPTYLILLHIFTRLTIGEIAWRVNLFSAFCGAITVALLYLILILLTGNRITAFTGAFMLAVTPLFWIHALVAELYTTASAFIALIIFLVMLWRKTDRSNCLYAAVLLGGLGLGVHVFVVFLFPGVFAYLVLNLRSRRVLLLSLLWGVFGVLLVIIGFLILDRSSSNASYYHVTVRHALSAWGLTNADFDTPFERLKFLWLPRQFSDKMFSHGQLFLMKNWQTYKSLLSNDLGWLGLALSLIGMVGLAHFRWREFLLLIMSWCVQTIFALNYKVDDFAVFFTTGYIFLSIFVGVGIWAILHFLDWGINRCYANRVVVSYLSPVVGLVIFGLLIASRFSVISDAWFIGAPTFLRNDQIGLFQYLLDDPDMPHRRAVDLVNALEDNAIVFSGWEDVYSYYFVAYLEQGRANMDFYEAYPQANGLAHSTADYISSNLGIRPIYFTLKPLGRQANKFVFASVSRGRQQLFEVIREK